jgi:tetratricopeptide (TPR) repeat protein
VSADRAELVRMWRTDLDMVDRLVEIRLSQSALRDGKFDEESSLEAYARAFREYGVDVERLDPDQAGELIRQRPARASLAAALDNWGVTLRTLHPDRQWKRLLAIARAADPDPIRVRIRDAIIQNDQAALRELAATIDVGDLPPATLHAVVAVLGGIDREVGWSLARRAHARYPDDFGLNIYLWKNARVHDPSAKGRGIEFLTAAAALAPNSPGARLTVGAALHDHKFYSDAETWYREAIRLKPDFAEAHYNLGVALDAMGKPVEAAASFREAVRLKPDFAEAHYNLGNALRATSKHAEAAASYREAIRLKPDLAEPHNNLGVALDAMGKPVEAAASFREAIRLKPDYAVAHNNLGAVHSDMGKHAEAAASYREAIRLKPDYAEAHCNLGDALYAMGKHAAAAASHREAIRLKPDDAVAHNNLGGALYAMGKHAAAAASIREAIRLKPDYAEAHYNLGVALSDQGKLAEAAASYREAVRLKPDFASAHYNLGNALRATSKHAAAAASYREAIRLKPDDAEAHNNLGLALGEMGKHAEAAASYREAIRHNPNSAKAHCNLGTVLRRLGRVEESLAAFRRGHELGSKMKNWSSPSAEWVREAEQLVTLDRKLPKVVAGEEQPADLRETLVLAELAYHRKWYAASAKLYAEVLLVDRKSAGQLNGPRYNAACAAILAGCGRGGDPVQPTDEERDRLRQRAHQWLTAELSGLAETAGDPRAKPQALEVLRHWQRDADLAPIRDEAELKTLPEAEQDQWRKLWADVAQLQARVEGRAVAPPPRPVK